MKDLLKNLLREILFFLRNALDLFFNFREVSVLCYHSLSNNEHETAIAPSEFAKHLDALVAKGFVFVSLSDVVAWAQDVRTLPRKAVALTFDDGYADFESVVAPVLKKYKAPSIVFVIGEPEATGWNLNEESPFLSQEALEHLRQNSLVELGYHSKTHPNLVRVSEGDLQKEVTSPFPARYFAYPGGNHSPQAVSVLRGAGYEAAFTIRPVLVRQGMDPYLLPRIVVTKDMQPRDVLMRVSKAADWYRALSNNLKNFFPILLFDYFKKKAMEKYYQKENVWGREKSVDDIINAIRLVDGWRYGTCLDVGTGLGHYAERASKFCNQVIAIDISKIAIQRAQTRLRHLSNIKLTVENIRTFAAEELFDLIILGDTLYYLGDQRFPEQFKDLISTIAHKVAPGGRLLLSNVIKPWSSKERLLGYAELFAEHGLRVEKDSTFTKDGTSWKQTVLIKPYE